jgi:hypothetical protein
MSPSDTTQIPTRGVIGIIGVLLGTGLMVWGFLAGIDAALNGAGAGALVFTIMFIVGAALVLAAAVIAIVRLVRGAPKALNIVTLVLAAIPAIAVFLLWFVNYLAS